MMADRRRIVQVIVNLLSNAARHSPASSAIHVSAVREGGNVEISVADQGRGIPAADLPLLFRKFARQEDRDAAGDTGLGLAICKGIVEAHGGRIRAESDGPGLGARFIFTLPVMQEAVPARPSARSQGNGQSAGTVLVVDDDPLVLRSVRDALSTAGFRVVATGDPEEAPALMAEHSPGLALLDLVLPEHDGEELMGDILAASRIPVIFLSAYGRDEVVARVLENGASDYIVKPFSPTELVARVRAALRRFGEPERPEPAQPFVLGDLTIDYAQRRVTVSGREAPLTAQGVRPAGRALDGGRARGSPRAAAQAGVEPGKAGEPAGAAHTPDAPAPQAGRGRRQPEVHLRRAAGGLQDAGGGHAGTGVEVGIGAIFWRSSASSSHCMDEETSVRRQTAEPHLKDSGVHRKRSAR